MRLPGALRDRDVSTIREGDAMENRTLGVDLGIRATHVATLCNERGERVWSRRRFGNRRDELEALVGEIGECDELI